MIFMTRKEKKYRTKIIQEQHLRKFDQIWLDKYIKDNKITYKAFYEAKLQPPPINAALQAVADMAKLFEKIAFKAAENTVKAWDGFVGMISGIYEGFFDIFDKE